MTQLEFDLWAELRVSDYDMVRGGPARSAYNEAMFRAWLYGESNVMLVHDTMSMHTIVRYRV